MVSSRRQKGHRRELIDLAIDRYHGHIVKTTGDGMLVEFPRVRTMAVRCAVDVQMAWCNRKVRDRSKSEFSTGLASTSATLC